MRIKSRKHPWSNYSNRMIEGSDSFLLFLIAYATLDPIVSQLGRPGGGWNKWRKSRGKHILWQKAPVWRTTKSWTPFNAINERQAITVYIRTISSLLLLKSVYKRMSLYKCPLYDHSWPFFCHMFVYLSQNWGSDGYFEVLNGSKSWLGQKLWPQM